MSSTDYAPSREGGGVSLLGLSSGGGCSLDNVDTPCDIVASVLRTGGADSITVTSPSGQQISYSIDPIGLGQGRIWIPGGCVTTSGGDGGSPDTTTCVPPEEVSLVDFFGLFSSGGVANNYPSVSAAPPQPPTLKPGCSSGGVGPAIKAAASDFFVPPGSDPLGDLGDALREKNNQRAGVWALYVTADALKLASPVAAIGAKAIPVVGWAILGYQLYSAGKAGWEAYKQSVDQCYGGG